MHEANSSLSQCSPIILKNGLQTLPMIFNLRSDQVVRATAS